MKARKRVLRIEWLIGETKPLEEHIRPLKVPVATVSLEIEQSQICSYHFNTSLSNIFYHQSIILKK
jgi:hypothetical protein